MYFTFDFSELFHGQNPKSYFLGILLGNLGKLNKTVPLNCKYFQIIFFRRKEEEGKDERRASSHELREGRRGSVETVRKVSRDSNLRKEFLFKGPAHSKYGN